MERWGVRSALIAAAAVLLRSPALCGAYRNSVGSGSLSGLHAEYSNFRSIHRAGEEDSIDMSIRASLYEARKAEVEAHNAKNLSWTLTLNRFSDFTDEEKSAFLGYKRVGGRWGGESTSSSSLMETEPSEETSPAGIAAVDVSALAEMVDWRSKMNSSNFVHDQGSCGSCWAHSAIGALEAHAELALGLTGQLATQQVIDCTANPRKCGGTGGCHGATAEMAFEYVKQFGLPFINQYSGNGFAPSGASCRGVSKTPALKIDGWVRLPENRASYLLNAMANMGPVSLSVDAANLFLYNGGVFAGCKRNAIVNHAVLGVGYGIDRKLQKQYWLVKNSWGASWGEKGYIRVLRHDSSEEKPFCGIDNKPQDGVYCEDAPPTIPVCGMCGILSDSAYPVIRKKALRLPGQIKIATLG